ncbi:O-antigen ligase [Methylocystis sp. ATCC 49242]|uniref:O-antigen ligase family protein n=1 Tax=Methylocystis sp. ATCC 49242 TaxID=622637 RepID=UPI0001F87172|nr:O-antigen ligase family protein [Methylocystis sp. ATCC 49242]
MATFHAPFERIIRLSISKPIFDSAAPSAPARLPGPLSHLWRESKVEALIFFGLLLGLTWAPFWLGGNRITAWGINGVYFPTLTLLYECYLLTTGQPHPIGLRRLNAPATLFGLVLLWIGLQLAPTPPMLAHPIWGMAADALGQPIDGAISVNRGETLVSLIRLLTAASLFWLAVQLCRNSLRAHALLRAVSLIVAAYSAYAIILAAFFAGEIPPFDAPASGGFLRATFVNRNSFATYAGLGLVVTVALTLRLFRHEVPASAGLMRYRLTKFIEATGRRGWSLLGAGFVTVVALLGTVSRGGILATALGVFALLAMSFSRQQRRGGDRVEAVVFIAVALVASFMFFGDLIVGRMATSGLEDTSRISVYVVVMRSILDTPLLGFGYGTFADVFPMYRDQSIPVSGVWDKAHDSYLEIWHGLGLLFGSALILSVCWIAARCFRGALTRRRDATPALAATAASILVGAHALVDFSLQMEGVALTFLAILGAGAAQAESSLAVTSD